MIDSVDKIKVIPRLAVEFINHKNCAAVSFHGGGIKPTYPSFIKFLLFFDVPDLDPNKRNHIKAAEKYKLKIFTEEDAKELVDFVNKVRPIVDMLYFQCEAGVSRSAGAASAVSKAWFNDDTKFIHESINKWIYNLILKEFGK